MTILTGEHATIVQHCAVFGRIETAVRTFQVSDVKPYAQYDLSVTVTFQEPRKRRRASYTMHSEDTRYLTIEVRGAVVYDSRQHVPCDMDWWAETRKRFETLPAITVTRN